MKLLRIIKYYIRQIILQLLYIFTNKKMPREKNIYKINYNSPYRLKIPTYDGSGQAVHPSVLIDSCTNEFYLAYTPYTNTNDKVENPSIVCSKDGFIFNEEYAGINPLVNTPEIDHNDDPDLFIHNDEYCILYLETLRPEKQNLILLSSYDRQHWDKRVLFSEKCGGNRFILSPSYIETNNKNFIFYVNKDSRNGHSIEYVSGNSINEIDYGNVYLPTMRNFNDTPWHLDIVNGEDGYMYMLVSCVEVINAKKRYYLKIARSKNINDWDFSNEILFYDCYRSSLLIHENDIYVYLSRIYFGVQWKISLIRYSISELFVE